MADACPADSNQDLSRPRFRPFDVDELAALLPSSESVCAHEIGTPVIGRRTKETRTERAD
jgi:hypothetical protein